MAVDSFFKLMEVALKKTAYPTEEEIAKHGGTWMMNQYLSSDESLVGLAHELSKLKLSNKEYFDVVYYGIPKVTRYIKYNASRAKKDQDLKYISDYFKCSLEQAKTYYALLPEEEKKQIIEGFTNRGFKK